MTTNTNILWLIIAVLLSAGFVYANEPKPEFVMIDQSECTMNPCPMDKTKRWGERAWVVSEHVVITMPHDQDQVMTLFDGMFRGRRVLHVATVLNEGFKAYATDQVLVVSTDIPKEVMETYKFLLPEFDKQGGILNLIDEEKRLRGIMEVGA